jgi:hypothetical protein
MTTKTTREYLPGEALTARITAREWTEQFWPELIDCMVDEDCYFDETTRRGHCEAVRLGIPFSPRGSYPPVVWELDAMRHS